MYQDNYELPSIFNQKNHPPETIEQESVDLRTAPSQHQALLNDAPQGQLHPYSNKDRQLAWLLLFTPLIILIMTAVPAVASFPNIDSMTSGNAIWRLFDPVSFCCLLAFLKSNLRKAVDCATQPIHHVLRRYYAISSWR